MKLVIFSVHDSKAEAFLQPFFCPTVAVGVRMFAHAANDPTKDFSRFAADYTLFELGEFEQDTGEITMLKVAKNHGLALRHIDSGPASEDEVVRLVGERS